MTLENLLSAYLSEREASPRYQESLRRTVKRAGAYGIGRVDAITPEAVNKFLSSVPVSPVTRSNMRREILTLWRWGFDRMIVESPPWRVMRIKATPKPPRAWSLDTLRNLLEAAERDETPISARYPHVRRMHVLPAWIGLGYDSGLRLGDLLSLRADSIANGCVICNAQKTGKVTVRRLSEYTLGEVARLLERSPDGTLFSWCLPRRRAILMWRSFLRERGVSGAPRWLRRSGATYVEIKKRGESTRFLGHSNPTLAPRFYIDASLTWDIPESPPPLR